MSTRLLGILIVFIAIACINEERIRKINESEFHKEIGFAYYIEKNYQLAYSEFHKALQFDPNNKDAIHGLALVHMEFQEYDIAKDLFLKTLAIDSSNADAWFNLGVCYQRLNMHKQAIDAFRKALDNPLFVTQDKAYFGQGVSFYRIGQYEEAKKALEKAINRNLMLIPAHIYLSLTYQKLHQYSEALNTLKNSIKLDQRYKGDLDKFIKNLVDDLKNRQNSLPEEDILDILEILRY